LYNFFAKNTHISIKQSATPKGSSIIHINHSSITAQEVHITVSAQNHVANAVAVIIYKGKFLPDNI